MQNEPVKDPLDIASELSCWFGQVDNLEFTLPFEILWKTVRNAKGSGGTDQWTGCELRYMPLEAIRTWHQLAEQWVQLGDVPNQLKYIRQMNKVDAEGKIPVRAIRPVSVMSASWGLCMGDCLSGSGMDQQI